MEVIVAKISFLPSFYDIYLHNVLFDDRYNTSLILYS